MSTDPRTTDTDAGADEADDDVMSDPSKGADDDRVDWSDEGGATSGGPAPAT
ncbi:MAG: hypothetical protein PGN37_20865 [Mycobacterium kyogaense]|uniref:hypothetical protein n=1 Tax=Mycobacterium kyogaense TaxID=2212479 RepID=UPI002FFA803D